MDQTKSANKRNLHPSVFKKIRKTKKLIEKGVDPDKFIARGGLDLETFNTLNYKRKQENKLMAKHEEKLINKYGSLKAASLVTGPCKKKEPVIGTKNALVLLTEFKDVNHTYDSHYFQDFLFSKGENHSMRDYFLEASSNQLDINGKVHEDCFKADGNLKDYIDKKPVRGDFPKAQKLVRETILNSKKSGIDYKPFSKDGKIELLIIIYAGQGLDTKLNIKAIWPHQDRLNNPIEVEERIWADKYCIIPEYPPHDLGCFCHEVAHILGLPDLYNNYSPVVGNWCLMGAGGYVEDGKKPAHPSAWCKVQLGWNEPQIIKKLPSTHEIPAIIDENGVIYKVEVEGSEGREYFLLENRQKKGFDSGLPYSGLLIWHINENHCVNLQPNAHPDKLFLTLKQSDGSNELQRDRTATIEEEGLEAALKDLGGDEGDPYPGITLNRTFDRQSHPNSDSDTGLKSTVSISSISDSQDNMEAHIGLEQGGTDVKTSDSPTYNEYKLFLLNFINRMNSIDDLTPYKEGYEAGREDVIFRLKEELELNSYKDGYIRGYLQGYLKALKRSE